MCVYLCRWICVLLGQHALATTPACFCGSAEQTQVLTLETSLLTGPSLQPPACLTGRKAWHKAGSGRPSVPGRGWGLKQSFDLALLQSTVQRLWQHFFGCWSLWDVYYAGDGIQGPVQALPHHDPGEGVSGQASVLGPALDGVGEDYPGAPMFSPQLQRRPAPRPVPNRSGRGGLQI